MAGYLLRRTAEIIFVLLLLSFCIYGLIGLMPGDPIDLMINADPDLTTEDAQRLKALLGLERPIHERYLAWLGQALNGDFGYSRLFSQPVLELMGPRLWNSVLLMGLSLALALAIALPLGIIAAARRHGLFDGLVNLCAFAGISVPPFWLAILLILLFAVTLGWLPASGMGDSGDPWWARARYLVLPVMALTLASVGGFLRFTRASVAEAARQDYVRTAAAKGLSERRILLGHVLRNAMIPVVTVVALNFGTLFSGALITETIFGWLGMGKTIYDAIMGSDYNLALAGLLFAAAVTLIANLLADLAYAWLDPRITYR